MPKVVAHTILWLAEQASYVRYRPGSPVFLPVVDKEEQWFSWLATCSSFAFQGKQGHLTLRKESRAHREDYWYAYRCQKQRTVKRYAGRTASLAIARLEEIAGEISAAFAVSQTQPTEGECELPAILPLLITKLSQPRLHRSLVGRERLIAQFDACLEYPLTLVCAPAGSGKTTLVRQWLAARGEQGSFPRIAWISLDAGDNDPVRFWHTVLAASQTWFSAPEQHFLKWLGLSSQPSITMLMLEVTLTTFLNEAAGQNISGLFILDDYHVLSEGRIQETLSFFLAHLPETLHMVLLTRQEPPLPLARLRANGELNEIRASDLRFSLEESAAFLQEFALSPQALERLDTCLEGWAAGLRLLSLSLQGKKTQQQIERTLTTFSGNHRPILDYFVSEVLHTQPQDMQDFLLRTSILPRLTPSLCSAVTGRQESANLLEQIERDNLFLEALDETGDWYRYHTLFADAMQYEAYRCLGEDEFCQLSHIASCWFEQQGLISEAIEAALKARDSQRAAGLMEQFFRSPQIHEVREYYTLRRWLEHLPEELLKQSPLLCFGYAVALTFERNRREPEQMFSEQVEGWLQRAEEGWHTSNDLAKLGTLYAFRSITALRLGKLGMAATWARQALTLLPETDVIWRGTSVSALAFRALREGQLHEARHFFLQVHSLGQMKNTNHLLGLATLFLGIICFEQGKLHQATSYYRELSRENSQPELSPASLFSILPMTLILYERNELGKLEEQTQKISGLARQFSSIPQSLTHVAVELPLACLQHARGETGLAIQRLENLWINRQGDESDFPFYFYQEALYWLVRLSLALRDLSGARRWLSELVRFHWQYGPLESDVPLVQAPANLPVPENGQMYNEEYIWQDRSLPVHHQKQRALLTARLALLQGQPEVALQILSTLLSPTRATGRGRSLLQIKLLMAQAYAACQQPVQARQWLLEALEQGYPEGYQRTFLDEGASLVPLLREILPHLRSEPLHGYVQILLQGFLPGYQAKADNALSPVAIPVEPLSPQEQRVLHLLIAGRSNSEMARELVVSVNTIRTQLQSIYRKLQVHNRHAAREAAQRLRSG